MPVEPDTGPLARCGHASGAREPATFELEGERPERSLEPAARNVASEDTTSDSTAAFAHLRPEDQEILRLSSWERLSYREASAILHCSPNAYAIRLHRARLALRLALDDRRRTRPIGIEPRLQLAPIEFDQQVLQQQQLVRVAPRAMRTRRRSPRALR